MMEKMISRRGLKSTEITSDTTSLEDHPVKNVTIKYSPWTFAHIIGAMIIILVLSVSKGHWFSSMTQTIQVHKDGKLIIPECDSSNWKPNEDLVGNCPGRAVSDKGITNPIDCSKACCADPNCIMWQFRADTGCIIGEDVRIGMEKDGPAAYCSAHPPLKWQGQNIKKRKNTECSETTWHPDEENGQCFGLGDRRQGIDSSLGCMKACCSDDSCGAWQFHESVGCFYNSDMFSCQKSDDPIVFEPFVGRRKHLSSRTYSNK
jgi:hypothetical protein